MSDDNELTAEAAERLWKMIEDLGAASATVYTIECWGTWGTEEAHWAPVRTLPDGSGETEALDALKQFRKRAYGSVFRAIRTKTVSERAVIGSETE